MKKSIFVALSSFGILAVTGTVCFATLSPNGLSLLADGDPYEMVFNDKSQIVSLDNGYLHEYEIKNNLVDFIGWESGSSALGTIKQKTYGTTTYKGMVFNKSIINGFVSLKVNFTGGSLYYKFTDYLMEDMDFDNANAVTSNVAIQADGKPYFVLYTNSTTGVNLESIEAKYECDGSIDQEFIFDKTSATGNGRSSAKSYSLTDSFIEIENRPTATNNNYSDGTDPTSGKAYTWYRWNGKEFNYSASQIEHGELYNLGDDFDIYVTILGNISQAINSYADVEDNYFHFAVWPEFSRNMQNPNNSNWVMTYIGNDNYEPLGKDDPNRIHTDTFGDYSYAGRFFGRYEYFESISDWEFGNPDVMKTRDDTCTLREAYEAYNLPFWFIKYEARTVGTSFTVDTYINGFWIESDELFDDYDKSNESMSLWRWPMYSVNYGDTDRNPAASYKSVFTYPRIVKYK